MEIEMVCTWCGERFTRERSQTLRSVNHYCSKSCSEKAFAKLPEIQRVFPSDEEVLHDYNNGMTYKAIAVKYRAAVSSVANVFRRLGVMANYRGRLPRGNTHHFYRDIPLDKLASSYNSDLMTLTELAKRYHTSPKTISMKLHEVGVKCRPRGYGKNAVCQDGHVVRSSFEQIVDDWLSEHGIVHEIEPHLPWNRRRCADFLVEDCYIEVWGVVGNSLYDARKREKIADYAVHNCNLIELYPNQILDGDFSLLEVLNA